MARKPREYEFRIDAYSPDSIPMARLAEYMASLATLFGEHKSVHFIGLKPGSTAIVQAVEYEAEPKVRARLQSIRSEGSPADALRAARTIDRLLAEDNASGVLTDPVKAKIIDFPGKRRFNQPQYGPFNQPGTLDGIPIRVGGETDPVPVHLEEPGQPVHICSAARVIAREIAPYIFSTMIRAEGVGRWYRDGDGRWILDKFTIHSFKKLKDLPLSEAVERLRAIPSKFRELEDPLTALREIRQGRA